MEKHYQTQNKVPEWVDPMKVLEWTFKSPAREGVISIHQVYEEATKQKFNWLLFYCWMYVRTSGFTTQGMKDWDYGNFGGKFKTSRDGIRDALSEFIKYPSTELMNEGKAVVILYDEIEAFCRGVVWTEPKPLPEPKPEPLPPKPETPKPKPEKPPQDEAPSDEVPSPKPNIPWVKFLIPVLIAGLTAASYFVPAWAKVGIDLIIKLISGL
jgi:hypothetical protein